MTQPQLSPHLSVLQRYSTPTVANAIELFEIRPRTEGYLMPGLQCLLPDAPPLVGYAATCTVAAYKPEPGDAKETREYWDHVMTLPAPRVSVVQDVDTQIGRGSFWGEVNANVHLALDCHGCVTNGGIRDLPEMRKLGFNALYGVRCVSHGYIHVRDFGKPVTINGVTISPGDLLQADEHGVLVVPHEVLPHLEEAVHEMERRERPVIEYCQSGNVDRPELWNTLVKNMRNPPKWKP